jgi:hypothetical protein
MVGWLALTVEAVGGRRAWRVVVWTLIVCATLTLVVSGAADPGVARAGTSRAAPAPVPQSFVLEAASCSSPTACTAVGASFMQFENFQGPVVERWDGKTWSTQPISVPAMSSLASVACPSDRVWGAWRRRPALAAAAWVI